MEITIGTKFIRQGRKRKDIETVIDIYKTYNSKGELVKTRYVSEKEFMGQTLRDYDVLSTTIKIGLELNKL